MGICEGRTRLKPVNLCNDYIEIGKMPDTNRAYEVKFKNLATGGIYIQSASSDGDGILTIPGNFLSQGVGYEMRVKDKTTDELADVQMGAQFGRIFLLDLESRYDVAAGYYLKGTTEKLEIE